MLAKPCPLRLPSRRTFAITRVASSLSSRQFSVANAHAVLERRYDFNVEGDKHDRRRTLPTGSSPDFNVEGDQHDPAKNLAQGFSPGEFLGSLLPVLLNSI